MIFPVVAACVLAEILLQTALLDYTAALSCPHADGDVTWSRKINGEIVPLLSIRGGQETRLSDRYGSLADGALVIRKVQDSDETVYLCNGKKTVYLKVNTGSSEAAPPEDESLASTGSDNLNVDLEPDREGGASDIQRPSD